MAAPMMPPQFTVQDLAAINAAISSGATEVRFQDRTVRYRDMKDLILARTTIWNSLYPNGAPNGQGGIRQIRMYTSKGL